MKKVLIITYYWPPSGGSGVQRWMYFAKFLPENGYEPHIITVDPKFASYSNTDENLLLQVKHLDIYKTKTIEPLKVYSYLTTGDSTKGIPQGGVPSKNRSLLKKTASFIRGNFFIPDARRGWVNYAYKKAQDVIRQQQIDLVITTGPPHSTHLVGLKLKQKLGIKWLADLRDPWSQLYYNKDLYRTKTAQQYDEKLEKKVLEFSDINLTVGHNLNELFKKIYPKEPSKFQYIYNGFDSDLLDSIHPVKKPYFEITFIGLLTDHQPFQSFIKTVKGLLQDIPKANVKVCLAGRISENTINQFVSELNGIEIINHGYITHKKAIQLMKDSNCLVNCLADMENDEILISGKQMEYVSTGNPILCFGNTKGESAMILNKLKYSCMVDKTNIKESTSFLINLYQNWSESKPLLNNTESDFIKSKSRKETTKQLVELLDSLQ